MPGWPCANRAWSSTWFRSLGDGYAARLFITGYGLAQPVLPAVLVDPAPIVWKTIGILRAGGWYALAPFLLYAIFHLLAGPPRKRTPHVALVGAERPALAGAVLRARRRRPVG